MTKKTRVAIYYDNRLRNDGPPLYYYNQLKKNLDLDVVHSLPEGDTFRVNGKRDVHIWVDFGEDSFSAKAMEWMPLTDGGKSVYIASDTHLDDGYRYRKAQGFDYVFFNQKHALDGYPKIEKAQYAGYLAHAAEPEAYPHFEILKKYDLCFIGHMQEYHKGNGINMSRIDVLDHMFKKFPNFYFGSRNPVWPDKNMFEDAAKKFCQSKIVFNISIGNDVNMRFFETLAAGSFLLTNKIPELEAVKDFGFVDGKHYVSYDSLDAAENLIKFYTENDEKREMIAKAGYEQALKTGTYKSRLDAILKIVIR